MSLLLDTGVLFAFLYDQDKNHERALSLMAEVWRRQYGTPYVSTWVVDELFSLIRFRRCPPVVERAAAELLVGPEPALGHMKLVAVGPERLPAVWTTFDRYRDRSLSATDASHLVLMAEHGIDALATFESGFDGLVPVLPGPAFAHG